MSRITKTISSLCITLIMSVFISVMAAASAGGGSTVGVSFTGQTVDTIRFGSVTVEAKYSLGGGYGNSEYSCAALVMKFYKAVYGIDVWNLSSSGAVPTASNGVAFTQTASPRVGDIVRFQDRTHWALVKAVNGNTVTLIEQNWGYYSGGGYVAAVGRTITLGDPQVSYFTYASYGETLEKQAQTKEEQKEPEYATWEEAIAAAFDEEQTFSVASEDNLKLVATDNALENTLTNSLMG